MRFSAVLLLPLALYSQDTLPPAEAARREIRAAHELLAEADAGASLGRRLAPEPGFLSEAQAAYQEALSNFEQDRNLEARELAASAKMLLRAQDLLLEAQQALTSGSAANGVEQSARRFYQRTAAGAQELQTKIRQAEVQSNTLDSISRKSKAILDEAARSLRAGQWQRAIALTRAADAGVQAGSHLLSGRKLAAASPEMRGKAGASSAFQQKQ
jgi:hypothetical protein